MERADGGRVRAMTKLRLRFVVEDVDRHGNVRTYFRRKGHPKVRLPGLPGSREFMDAYQAALDARSVARRQRSVPAAKGTFRYVCVAYYASPEFKALDESTRAWRRRALDEIALVHGHKPISRLESVHIRQLRDEKQNLPGASRTRLKALKALFGWAVEAREVPRDPAREVRPLRHVSKGHHTWTVEEVKQFENCHPIGSQARLAMTLLLYTAGRREDAVRLGPQHIRDGRIRFRQAKNEHRSPVEVDIPVHPELVSAIEVKRSGHLTFLVTAYGRPFTPSGFGNKFRDWCDQAGLQHCSAHGLRKAAAVRLAEAGATAHEIMAVTGHKSLEEVERYTREIQRRKLADSAMAKLKR